MNLFREQGNRRIILEDSRERLQVYDRCFIFKAEWKRNVEKLVISHKRRTGLEVHDPKIKLLTALPSLVWARGGHRLCKFHNWSVQQFPYSGDAVKCL